MADVFLSYAHQDRRVAAQLAEVISKQGWSVWWDNQIRVGTLFPRAIEREIDLASCVVVVWSRYSVDSDWVRSEATEGLKRNILVPVAIEAGLRYPLQFRDLITADLSLWLADGQGLTESITAIRELVTSAAVAPEVPQQPPRESSPPRAQRHHLQHHAVTAELMLQDQPLLWSVAKNRSRYFTARHPAVIGTVIAFGLVLALMGS